MAIIILRVIRSQRRHEKLFALLINAFCVNRKGEKTCMKEEEVMLSLLIADDLRVCMKLCCLPAVESKNFFPADTKKSDLTRVDNKVKNFEPFWEIFHQSL
jgi:hypothetical protein